MWPPTPPACASNPATPCILRGGSDSLRSSLAIHAALAEGLRPPDLPETAVQIVPTADRAARGV